MVLLKSIKKIYIYILTLICSEFTPEFVDRIIMKDHKSNRPGYNSRSGAIDLNSHMGSQRHANG